MPFEQRGRIYAELLNLSHDLKKSQRNLNALILIIESQRVTKRRKLVSFYQDAMKEDLADLKAKFFDFFFENSRQRRISYFSDKLVQALWNIFKEKSPQTFTEYFQELQNSELGQLKIDRLTEDIHLLQ